MQIQIDRHDARSGRARSQARRRPTLALGLVGALVLGGLGLVGGPAVSKTLPHEVRAASSGTATLVAATARPRALLSYVAVRDARGRLVVNLSSNAKKVKVTYRSGKARSRTVKLRRGAAQVTVPAGATKVKALAKSTKRLRASRWITVIPTVSTPSPPPATPPPPTPDPPPPTPVNPPPPRGGTKLLGLPPKGPASPDTPPPFSWYEAIRTLNCRLNDSDAIPRGMSAGQYAMFISVAQVCRNLTEQAPVDWAAAASALNQTTGESDCLIVAVRSLLSAAVAAHEADPTAVLAPGPAAAGTACPLEIAVTISSPGTTYILTIQGKYLFEFGGVTVAGVPFQATVTDEPDLGNGETLFTITATGSTCLPAGQSAPVTVTGSGYQVTGSVTPTATLGVCSP